MIFNWLAQWWHVLLVVLLVVALATPVWKDLFYFYRTWQDERKQDGTDSED